ncbi:MAG: sigma-70 family RNA polymerase sigma factor [Planctomycetes bacterium]|nr:sigma-70 family RNA polymerase sigma factor [Planctomycetota bacterium]
MLPRDDFATVDTDDLLARAKGGDAHAYGDLFRHLEPRLQVYVRVRLGPQLALDVDSHDVVQEILLLAHRDFARFDAREPGGFVRWLFVVADHRLRDLATHYAAQKRRPAEGLVRGDQALAGARDSHTSPSAALGREERREMLARALERLPEDEREALILRHFQELTLMEVAERLQRSEPAVRRLLGRAHRSLGRALRAEGDGP